MAVAARRRRPEPDEEEEEQSPHRRSRMSDEEDAAPARRRRPAQEDAEDEPDEEEFEEAPRARRTSPARDTEEEDRPRRRPGGPRAPSGGPGRRGTTTRTAGRVASGWGGYNKVKAEGAEFEEKYKPSSDGDVIQLLEEEPFAAFARHWVDLPEGKRAFICPASLEVDEDDDPLECPLCDVGDKPNNAKAYINVATLKRSGRPEHAVWEFGGSVSDQLQVIDKGIGRKTALNDIYILASSSGSGLKTKYQLEPLFEEDLAEFEVKPLTEKQLNSFTLYDASLYEVPTFKELDKVADQIA